jgi:hypothetical protein
MSPRVLLITPQFYGIEKEIISVLEKSGYEVVWIENKTLLLDYHGTKSKLKLFRRLYYFLFSPQKKYLKSEFKKIPDTRFDFLFAINAHVINNQFIKKLKKANQDLVSLLYLWDSSGMYNFEKEIKCFDKVFTFDSDDSLKYGINYKPNFFLKTDLVPAFKNDLFFVGKFSTDRKLMIDWIFNNPGLESVNSFVKLYPAYKILPHSYFIYNYLKKTNHVSGWKRKYVENFEAFEGITESKYISHEPIPFVDFNTQLMASNVILDIPFENQSGYTHRVIQALANGKKVLTTNTRILKEDFFNPSQIHIINPDMPVEIEWLKATSIFPVDKYFHNLELSVWVNSILNAPNVKNQD